MNFNSKSYSSSRLGSSSHHAARPITKLLRMFLNVFEFQRPDTTTSAFKAPFFLLQQAMPMKGLRRNDDS
jgi:hypothetical protein